MTPDLRADSCPKCGGRLKEPQLVVGVTATRRGLSQAQRSKVGGILQRRRPVRAVHGDCVGGDDDFDSICAALGIPRGIRPCTYENLRAHCERRGAEVLAAPVAPMERNRAIVADVGLLIGCPPNFTRLKSGSGTWATIGFAERAKVERTIIFPDGTTG